MASRTRSTHFGSFGDEAAPIFMPSCCSQSDKRIRSHVKAARISDTGCRAAYLRLTHALLILTTVSTLHPAIWGAVSIPEEGVQREAAVPRIARIWASEAPRFWQSMIRERLRVSPDSMVHHRHPLCNGERQQRGRTRDCCAAKLPCGSTHLASPFALRSKKVAKETAPLRVPFCVATKTVRRPLAAVPVFAPQLSPVRQAGAAGGTTVRYVFRPNVSGYREGGGVAGVAAWFRRMPKPRTVVTRCGASDYPNGPGRTRTCDPSIMSRVL
jgi:hypothetical protein